MTTTASITVRFPADLHSRLRASADDSERSLSAEIVHRVRRSFAAGNIQPGAHGAQPHAGRAAPDHAEPHPGCPESSR